MHEAERLSVDLLTEALLHDEILLRRFVRSLVHDHGGDILDHFQRALMPGLQGGSNEIPVDRSDIS